MKELRIIFATICLLYIASMTLITSAKESENETEHTTQTSNIHHDDDNEESHDKGFKNSTAKARLESIREKNKKHQEKLRKKSKNKKIPTTQTGSTTNTGTTQTGATAAKPVTSPTKPVTSTPAPVATAVTHSQTVSYSTPEGSVPVSFSVTVKSGVITAASSTTKVGGTSGYYQDTFASKVSAAVVGKKVAGLNLSTIGGASLTTTAFEKFVAASF